MTVEKITYNACQGWGCHEHCILTTHVQDGKIVRTERTILKGPLAEGNGICQRGIMAAKFPYLPDRVLYPLKRAGERGEGKFQRISWQQAMNEIGSRLNETVQTYGPRSVIVQPFPCGYPNNLSGLGLGLAYRFVHVSDTSMFQQEVIDTDLLQAAPLDFGDGLLLSLMQNPWNLSEGKFIITWGGNPMGATRASRTSRLLAEAQERGVKIVHIGVMFDATAAKADQFIPVRSGTDAALALAMANTLIQERTYDENFLINRTVAPFLVREDNGLFLRGSDVVPNGDPHKYVVWNMVPGKPMFVDPHVFDLGATHPALEADVSVNGIRCRTAFLRLKEHIAKWTPETQETLTGVPPAVVRQLIAEYIENRPSTIFLNFGLRYMNGGPSARAISLLPVLSGNLGLRGGFVYGPLGDGYPVALNDGPVMFPEGPQNAKGAVLSMIDLLDSFGQSEGQQYKAWINAWSNPVQNWPNRKMWTDVVFPHMDLIVVSEVRMSDTALFADYVLPEATIFEREELVCPNGDCIVLNEPAIEPLGESKPTADIWNEFAKALHLERYFNKTTEEWLNIKLQTNDQAIAGITPPVTLERLRKEKIVHLNVPEGVFDYWANPDLATPSGRVEFYSEDMADVGGAMASYVEPQIHSPERKQYPLQLFPGRSRFFMQGQFQEFPALRKLAGQEPTADLNPADAAIRGIADGDWVEVFNSKGSVRVKAHLTEAFPPGMVHVLYAYPAKDYPTNPPTVLSTSLCTRESQDSLSEKLGRVWQSRQSGMPPTAVFYWVTDTHDTLWDDLCDVRKVEGGK